MNSNGARRAIWLLVAVAALAAVAVVAYNVGTGAHNGTVRMFGPMRGYGGYDFGFGLGGFGLLGALLIGFLLVWLFVALISGPSATQRPQADPGGVDRLRELAEMHDKGALTDDEFAAAKRKLLGL
jgi:uncharacterized membrane protein